ncbi:helix-turn-helix domain-containing protein [Corynebacterium ulcerans]|uniref:LexA family protein n=1 Tax=Corynebacterium ulcerans TaxID=65058 RepID=UPI0021559855|nr:helix-turn-helix domain-containing protein [Corynebacterium ulcerans]
MGVTQSKTDAYGCSTLGRATSSERKALAAMGRRGGKKAAKRWETDPNGDYAQAERKKLIEANRRKKIQGQSTRARVLAVAMDTLAQTGRFPSGREIAAEIGMTKRTVNLHLKTLRESGLIGTM